MAAQSLPEDGSGTSGPTPPTRLAVYQPPSSEIWVATLPNWRRRFAVAGALAVVGAGVLVYVFR